MRVANRDRFCDPEVDQAELWQRCHARSEGSLSIGQFWIGRVKPRRDCKQVSNDKGYIDHVPTRLASR
jgi:hypothetical protein